MTEYAKITLLIPVTQAWPRPDKTNWQTLTNHSEDVIVLGCEYLGEDELPADPTLGVASLGHDADQLALRDRLRAKATLPVVEQVEDPVRDHLAEICKDAGLGVMAGLFDVIVDREEVSDDTLLALDESDVTELYEAIVGPAVDRMQRRLA